MVEEVARGGAEGGDGEEVGPLFQSHERQVGGEVGSVRLAGRR